MSQGTRNAALVDSESTAGSDSNSNSYSNFVLGASSGLSALDQGSATTTTTTGTSTIQLAPSRAKLTFTKPERSTYYWDISEQVLSTLTSAAQSAPVPYLASLSAVALSIFRAVQGAKGNQAELGELAKMACDLVALVLKTYEDLNPPAPGSDSNSDADETRHQSSSSFSLDPTLNSHVGQLAKKLVRRIISYKSDHSVIQDLRGQLIEAKDISKITSGLESLRDSRHTPPFPTGSRVSERA
ncbi:hypothetical protein C8R42DRAFT_637358 [Lentinula raphanica]|nr:hypothetical protein C8R42DRAFT_637358 [Lentinula raphanica]